MLTDISIHLDLLIIIFYLPFSYIFADYFYYTYYFGISSLTFAVLYVTTKYFYNSLLLNFHS